MIFSLFLPFLAKKVVPDSRFSDARFFQGRLFDFLRKIWNPTVPDLAPVPDFFSCFVQIFYVFLCIVEGTDLSTRKQHDPTKVCRDEAAVGAMAALQGRRCPPPRLSLRVIDEAHPPLLSLSASSSLCRCFCCCRPRCLRRRLASSSPPSPPSPPSS